MRLGKLRIEIRKEQTTYFPIGTGARGRPVYLEPLIIKTEDLPAAKEAKVLETFLQPILPARKVS